VGILVSQLPPAELARLKAELAETLIMNFCYPRFFDYRTDSLRMRPVDRAKRQEVWQFLGSIDFSAWGRIDLLSPDFQRQVERLFIHFVQRNRNFFGEPGRKRMADIKMLIGTASSSVVQGLRAHLTGRPGSFGNPRPVPSWAKSNVMGRLEPDWDRIVAATMLLQQQLQELRGEIAVTTTSDARMTGTPAKRASRRRPTVNGGNAVEAEETPHQPISQKGPARKEEVRSTPPFQRPKITSPLASSPAREAASIPIPAPDASPVRKVEHVVVSEDTSTPSLAVRDKAAENSMVRSPERTQQATSPATMAQPRDFPQTTQAPLVEVPAKAPESTTVLVSDEDVVIFEQMRHQLVMWLRIEAVHAGIDISGQEPSELLGLLSQQDDFDETRLHVVSTLLNLANQIIATGHASLIDYKQATMFYLMHTRRSR
jgi:hypothetical protein